MASVVLMLTVLLLLNGSHRISSQVVDDSYVAPSNNRCVDDQGNAQVNSPNTSIISFDYRSNHHLNLGYFIFIVGNPLTIII